MPRGGRRRGGPSTPVVARMLAVPLWQWRRGLRPGAVDCAPRPRAHFGARTAIAGDAPTVWTLAQPRLAPAARRHRPSPPPAMCGRSHRTLGEIRAAMADWCSRDLRRGGSRPPGARTGPRHRRGGGRLAIGLSLSRSGGEKPGAPRSAAACRAPGGPPAAAPSAGLRCCRPRACFPPWTAARLAHLGASARASRSTVAPRQRPSTPPRWLIFWRAPRRVPRVPGARWVRRRNAALGRPARRRGQSVWSSARSAPRGLCSRARAALGFSRKLLFLQETRLTTRCPAGSRAPDCAVSEARRARGDGVASRQAESPVWVAGTSRVDAAAALLADGLGFPVIPASSSTPPCGCVVSGGWCVDRDCFDDSTVLLWLVLAVGLIFAFVRFYFLADATTWRAARRRSRRRLPAAAAGRGDLWEAARSATARHCRRRSPPRRARWASARPSPRRGAARPRRPGGDRGALGHRRVLGHRAAPVVPAATTRLLFSRLRPWQLASVAPAAVEGAVGLRGISRRGQRAVSAHRRAQRRGVRARGRRPRPARRPAGRGARGGRGDEQRERERSPPRPPRAPRPAGRRAGRGRRPRARTPRR